MKRVLVGLDLNGRADFAARDRALDDPDKEIKPPMIISGGVAGDIVDTLGIESGDALGSANARHNRRMIAGPQARIAPHGRGMGWGPIGDGKLRRRLAPVIDFPTVSEDERGLRAAIDAMARGADSIVLTVPDIPVFDEARQGAVLGAAMDTRKRRRVRLLWRPVAAFLDLLNQGRIPSGPVGTAWDILVHGPAGIEMQRLTLVADPEHPSHVAPRRDGAGQLIFPQFGLDTAIERARIAVMVANPSIIWDRCEETRLGARLLTGDAQPKEIEILRTWNGTWTSVTAPVLEPSSIFYDAVLPGPQGDEVAGRFLITPLAELLAHELAVRLAPAWPGIIPVASSCIACGALLAGRLIERGLPHYFDRIERIAIAVMRDGEPEFADLIGTDVVVPADREYVSPPLDGFRWPKGKTEVEFYICKGRAEIRHWIAERDQGPSRAMPVRLRVRQTPGQSWARLAVTSSEWDALARAPVALDWETIAPLAKTPEEVLDELRMPPPAIPNRIIEMAHVALWIGSDWAGNGAAASLARLAKEGRPVNIALWARVLNQSRRSPDHPGERLWHVGTDGDLPSDLPDDLREGFFVALSQIGSVLTSGRPQRDNKALQAATWCFAACPEAVQNCIVDALEAQMNGRTHPLLRAPAAIGVVKQGAGRAVTGVTRIHRLLAVIAESGLNNHDMNALAMILTRRIEAPEALSRELLDLFARRLGEELVRLVQTQSFNVKFRNTLSAIAGLFRWRERDRQALLASKDSVAENLRRSLSQAQSMLSGDRYRHLTAREQKLDLIAAIIAYLDGGGDPDILEKIEAVDMDDHGGEEV